MSCDFDCAVIGLLGKKPVGGQGVLPIGHKYRVVKGLCKVRDLSKNSPVTREISQNLVVTRELLL